MFVMAGQGQTIEKRQGMVDPLSLFALPMSKHDLEDCIDKFNVHVGSG